MDKFDLYNVNFTRCSAIVITEPGKAVQLRKVCIPIGKNETETKCASNVVFNRDCNEYAIFAEENMVDGIQLQCYIECSVSFTPTPTNAAFTTYPTFVITFVITFVALLFGMILSSKRSH